MLIPLNEIIQKYNLNVKGVIQVGAHWAEEHDIYVQLGIKNIVYIEPCKEAFNEMLRSTFGGFPSRVPKKDGCNYLPYGDSEGNSVVFCNVACGEEEGEFDMYVSRNNQGQSNSLLKPLLHLRQHPEVIFTDIERVKVIPLDKLQFTREKYNLLVLDCQGAEGLILKGATETLKHIDCIYTEVNRDMTYENNMLIDEMDVFLFGYDFVRVETQWASENLSWGDSVYLKQQNQA